MDIPKPGGSKRPLGILTVKDTVCQQPAKIVLEPVFEADIKNFSGEIGHERLLWLVADRVHERSKPGRTGVAGRLRRLNLFLGGWDNDFRTGNAAITFCEIEKCV
jgi:hypothetical protein